jgi:tetratricopeptide (TPR) repeat protein
MNEWARRLCQCVGIVVIVALAACAPQNQKPVHQQTSLQPPPVSPGFEPEPGLSPGQRYQKALGLLGNGENEYARVELTALIAEAPRYGRASDLIAQLDADPLAILGARNFPVTVQAGDTISTIAQQYLGDSLKFVILARYNNLAIPSQLPAGTRINVPGEQRQPRPTDPDDSQLVIVDPLPGNDGVDPIEPDGATTDEQDLASVDPLLPEETPAEKLAEARRDAGSARARGDLDGAIQTLEAVRRTTPLDTETSVLLGSLYLERGREAYATGNWDQAERDFRAGQRADPRNVRIQEQLFELETIRTANTRYDEGLQHLQRDQLEQAYDKIAEAVALYPELPGARQALDGVKPPLMQRLYRQAQQHFRRQELDAALASTEKILAIDPANSEARNLSDKVVSLQERIGEFNQPQN